MPTAKPIPFLGDLLEFTNSVLAKGTARADRQRAATLCLKALLEMVRAVLRSAPEEWTVQALAAHLVKQMPVRKSREEMKAAVLQALAGGALPWFSYVGIEENDLLRDECQWVAEHYVGLVLSKWPKPPLFESLDIAEWQDDETQTGPTDYGTFCWKGKEFSFPLAEWRLLRALWDEDCGVPEEVAREKVYQGRRQGNSRALWQVQLRAQDRLHKYHLPFKITRPEKSVLLLGKVKSLRKRSR